MIVAQKFLKTMDIFKATVLYLTVVTFAIVDGQSYRAGVVLYKPNPSIYATPDEQLKDNLNLTVQIMNANKNESDIFILPEYALTNIKAEFESARVLKSFSVNIGKVGDMLCTTNGTVSEQNLAILACAAKNNYYVVANLIEEDNNTYFSTDIVIDPNGVLKSKCRKHHIVNGTNFERGPNANPCTFTATFQNQSVVFALLYGTDLVYGIPDASKSDNVIVTAATKNNLPLNISVSLSQGFAISNGVNLIVADYNDVELNYGGSGIFYSNGTSVIAFNAANVPNGNAIGGILIKEIPIKPMSSSSIINVKSTIFGEIPKMNLEYINLPTTFNQTIVEGKHCIDKRCCNFKAELSADSIAPYQWIILQNKTNILTQEADIFFCGLVVSSANSPKLTFKNLTISVDDKQPDVAQTLPITLNQNFLPINFQFNKVARTITFDKENNIVVLFGIMEILGSPNIGTNTAFIVIIVLLVLALVALLVAFLVWRKRQAKNRRNF
ncbi:uncharacterized protein LOC130893813 [Diorhabda carinulata]|uniref:uncharacterized protein LOC130893813 n=1 Tax=Diorhabda carinulata TaxID=1163345 RepID=UPI0025A2347E|nr:uncharacterized protein LOC130893813 [Diorhabda carinulata]